MDWYEVLDCEYDAEYTCYILDDFYQEEAFKVD